MRNWLGVAVLAGATFCDGAPLLEVPTNSAPARLHARRDAASGQWTITEAGKPVLTYIYQTNYPGELLNKVQPGNLKYARPRSDYIHPLYGLDGAELTLDWPVDHPHHRGIYWAWPEVDYRGERGDLHALQRVFARPTGQCEAKNGADFAQIQADNLWLWEDREPIVHERATIRAWRAEPNARAIDLEFRFVALQEGVAIARRETSHYGGLNIRLAHVKDQQIGLHTDPAGAEPRMAWAELSGVFPGGREPVSLVVFQKPANPGYPGDWIQYPEINWFQPTFPAAETRCVLRKDQPLLLQFRLWIHAGKAGDQELRKRWAAYASSTSTTPGP